MNLPAAAPGALVVASSGLVRFARIGARLGLDALIGFDMGGTSTDVSVYAGQLAQRFEHDLAGTRLQAPMLDIHTIAAGGGSVLGFEDGRMQVGPASAGSRPGPACYGRGGPLTVTDLQVALGRLQPAFLPAVFGPAAAARIDPAIVRTVLEQRLAEIGAAGRAPPTVEDLAADWLDIAIEAMATYYIDAMRTVQPHGPYRLGGYCFGGVVAFEMARQLHAQGEPVALVGVFEGYAPVRPSARE